MSTTSSAVSAAEVGGTIIQFPRRNSGRVRKCSSAQSMGDVCLRRMHREGAVPENVVRLAAHRGGEPTHDNLALLLIRTMLVLSDQPARDRVTDTLRDIDFLQGDRRAAALLEMLTRSR